MSYHYNESLTCDLADEIHNLHACYGIECAGRLVCEQDFRVVYKCTRNCYSLALTARKLIRLLIILIGESDSVKRTLCTLDSLLFTDACDSERKLNVTEHGLVRDEVVALEDEADSVVTVNVPISIAVELCALAVYNEIARGVVIKTANDIEQRSLSAARCTENRYELVVTERDIYSAERVYGFG